MGALVERVAHDPFSDLGQVEYDEQDAERPAQLVAGEVNPGLDVHAAIVGLVPGDEDGQRDEHEEDVRHEAEPVQEALVGQRPVVGDAGSILLLAAKGHRHGEYLEKKN